MRKELISPPTPRLLSAPMAAAYLGLSTRSFDKQWKTGRFPAPHRIGRRSLWDRKLLDAHIDVMSGLTVEATDEVELQWTETA